MRIFAYQMVKFGLRSVNKTLHAEVDVGCRFCVVPFYVDVDVEAAVTVGDDFLVGFDGVDKMMCIVFQEVFCSEVIYAEVESFFLVLWRHRPGVYFIE